MCFGYFHLVLGVNSIQSLALLCWGLVVSLLHDRVGWVLEVDLVWSTIDLPAGF